MCFGKVQDSVADQQDDYIHGDSTRHEWRETPRVRLNALEKRFLCVGADKVTNRRGKKRKSGQQRRCVFREGERHVVQ
jgi:hypothetical protein